MNTCDQCEVRVFENIGLRNLQVQQCSSRCDAARAADNTMCLSFKLFQACAMFLGNLYDLGYLVTCSDLGKVACVLQLCSTLKASFHFVSLCVCHSDGLRT